MRIGPPKGPALDGAPDANELRGDGVMNGPITDPPGPDTDGDGVADGEDED